MTRKITSLFLVIAVVFSVLTLSVYAENSTTNAIYVAIDGNDSNDGS